MNLEENSKSVLKKIQDGNVWLGIVTGHFATLSCRGRGEVRAKWASVVPFSKY